VLAFLALAPATQAHEVWVECDGTGPARIYLGEPGEALPGDGDPEFEKLKAPRLVPTSGAAHLRRAGFIEVAAPAGDVRLIDDSVFPPWGEEGKKEGVIYYACAGRAEAQAILPLEIVPTAAHAASFVLIRDGKPVHAAKLTVITPDEWSKSFVGDAQGQVTIPLKEKGRYILSSTQEEKGDLTLNGGKVATIYHIATLTFTQD
jgi:hypothetical protein